MKVCAKVMSRSPLLVDSRLGINVARLLNRKLNKAGNRRTASTHTLTGSIRNGHSTLCVMLISWTMHPLVLISCAVVAGTGRPGGVVIHRRINRGMWKIC